MTMKHDSDTDHEVWLRCFTAALGGLIGEHQVHTSEDVAEICAKIADAALKEERKRRRDRRRDHQYQTLVAGTRS
jgi:hypothetical protein